MPLLIMPLLPLLLQGSPIQKRSHAIKNARTHLVQPSLGKDFYQRVQCSSAHITQ
jgi:hypothetical protein